MEGAMDYPVLELDRSEEMDGKVDEAVVLEGGEVIVGSSEARERDSDSPEVIFVASVTAKGGAAKNDAGRTIKAVSKRPGHNASAAISVDCVTSTEGQTKKKRAKRRFWEHPSLAMRNESGHFQSLFEDLRQHPEKFFNFYGMSMSTFDELLSAIKGEISKRDTVARMAITAEERLTVTLRYMAHGISFSFLGKDFMIGRSTISGIVRETCAAIRKVLEPTEMAWPTKERWTDISENFHRKTSFPNCLGAIDGKHIRIVSSQAGILAAKKSKNYNSIVLMVVADADYKFTAVEVGLYGGDNEGFSFNGCNFGTSLFANQLSIPDNRPLPDTTEPHPHVFIGGEDFPLHENLVKPFPGKDLDDKCTIFNYRLARAHSSVECALGILCHKWKLLRVGLTVAPEFGMMIVKTLCVLHNFVGERDGFNMEDSYVCHLEDYQLFRPGIKMEGKDTRQNFADYFVTPAGEVSWQYHGLEKS